MKLLARPPLVPGRRMVRAFTLAEVLISLGVVGIMFTSLYGGISSGLAVVNVARENLRATQIMIEKLEIVRLYTWSQLNTTNFVPASFTNYYYPSNAVNPSDAGTRYAGSIAITPVPFAVGYSNSLRLVTVSVNWTSGSIQRTRTMETLVTENGLQRYVY